MCLKIWKISFLIGLWVMLLPLIHVTHGKHLGFYFSDFKLKYDEALMNISLDMSIYQKNTRKHPVYLVPEVKIKVFQDIPRLHLQLLAQDVKNHKILANRTIDFCDFNDYINANVFFKSLLHHLVENLKFTMKCPFKKGTYLIKEHLMPNYVVPGLMQLKDKFLNIQKVKTRIGEHIKTIFESSYTTEVCEYD